MANFWDGFVGLTAGGYPLERRLAATTASAWFLSGRRVVRFFRDGPEAPALLARWERIVALAHPHLVAIFETGRLELAGSKLIYAVMEYPEENLGEVLRERRLDEGEARQVLVSVTEALAALHAGRLVHGRVTPWNIVAVGDAIKLTSDDVAEAGELTPAHDARSLGVTASELLTGAADTGPEAAPAAWRDFIRHAMEGWDAARLLRHLRGEPEPAPEPTPAPERAPRGFPKWGYGAVAAACVLAGLLMLPRQAPVAPAAPAAVPPPARAAASPAPAAPVKAWRVIAFTYSTRAAAQKKAHTLNRRHPSLRAEVFAPQGQRGYYLVSIGGRMTRAEALRLEQRTRGRTLPRDTYTRNFTE